MAKSNANSGSPRPYFVPSDVDFDRLPEELKAAITGIIAPAYRELVLEARNGLEKSAGVTLVHLLWLEILDQLDLGKAVEENLCFGEPDDRGKRIDRHLRLVGAKAKVANFLMRMQQLRRKWSTSLMPWPPFAWTDEAADQKPASEPPDHGPPGERSGQASAGPDGG